MTTIIRMLCSLHSLQRKCKRLQRRLNALDHLDEGPMLETLDYTIRIGSTPTFLYFDLYLYSRKLTVDLLFFFTATDTLQP